MPEILVACHSVTGRTAALARAVAEGVAEVPGCRPRLRDIGGEDPPTAADLEACAGLALGTPIHLGMMSTPVRAFLDSTAELWLRRALAGRPATVFCAAGSGAGREAALLSLWSALASHGMLLVPLGPQPEIGDLSAAHGASFLGAGTVAGPGGRPLEPELRLARRQGAALARVALALSRHD